MDLRLPTNRRTYARLGALAFAGAISAGTFALTASNTVADSKAGDGAATISGYAVTNVRYGLATATPSNIDFVTFDLDAAATNVKAKVVSSSTTYTDCTNSAGTSWMCDFSPDPTVASANQLSVISTS